MDITVSIPRPQRLLIVPVLLITAGAAACSSAPAPAATPAATTTTGTTAAGPTPSATPAVAGTENPPPGDIPDSTIYIPYRSAAGHYELRVPEGWARTVTGSSVSFTDKLNVIGVTMTQASAPTPASARSADVPRLQQTSRHFALAGISTVRRPAGPAVVIRYTADSKPDPVTGKVYTDAVERYSFYRNGVTVVLTLSGPQGADNVDPWRIVTSSFRWL